MSQIPRMISNTVVSQETTHICLFEIDSKIHTIRVVVRDNHIKEAIRQSDNSHQSITENQWIEIRSQLADKLL